MHSPNHPCVTHRIETPMNTFDPNHSPRLAPAWNAALDYLADSRWHPWTNVVDAMTSVTDIQTVTASNLLHDGVRNATFERQGEHSKGTRQLRLIKPTR